MRNFIVHRTGGTRYNNMIGMNEVLPEVEPVLVRAVSFEPIQNQPGSFYFKDENKANVAFVIGVSAIIMEDVE